MTSRRVAKSRRCLVVFVCMREIIKFRKDDETWNFLWEKVTKWKMGFFLGVSWLFEDDFDIKWNQEMCRWDSRFNTSLWWDEKVWVEGHGIKFRNWMSQKEFYQNGLNPLGIFLNSFSFHSPLITFLCVYSLTWFLRDSFNHY